MKDFYTRVFKYHYDLNEKLLGEIKTNINILPERTFPLFCHVLNAHQIWNSRILNTPSFATWQVHRIEDCSAINENNYKKTLDVIENLELDKKITYKTFAGVEYTSSILDILFHTNNHSTHHKGQIVSDFRQKDIAPIVLDYIFYVRE